MRPENSSFSDVIDKIQQLQDRLVSQRCITSKKSYEIETLKCRLESTGHEIECLKIENRKHVLRTKAFDAEMLRIGSRRKQQRDALRSVSLPATLGRRFPDMVVETRQPSLASNSLKSASWDSVGAKEKLDSEKRPSYLSEVISEDFDYTSDFETTLQDIGLEDNKYLKQKVQILERLLKESTNLHSQSGEFELMSQDGEYISRTDVDRLRREYDKLLRENAKLLSERLDISSEMDQLNSANVQLKREIEQFEMKIQTLKQKSAKEDVVGKVASQSTCSENGGSCNDCKANISVIEKLREDLGEQLKSSNDKYDKMVNYYDNVLSERALLQTEIQIQNAELMDDNTRLEALLKRPKSEAAREDQIQEYRHATKARYSSLRESLPLARSIDKDQLITQLTDELNRANDENSKLDDSLSEVTANYRSHTEYLEGLLEQQDQEKSDIIHEIQVKLEDSEFLLEVFKQKREKDPVFFKYLISQGKMSVHDMDNEEELELKLKKKVEEVRVLDKELQEAEDHRQSLEKQLKKAKQENKDLSQSNSQFKYAKDALDQIVLEYCNPGNLFPRKPETFMFTEDKLTVLANTLYHNHTMIKTLGEEVKWLETELDKQQEDQKSLTIENLEKMVANQKDQISDSFQDTIKYKCRIQDLEDDLRNTREELHEKQQQIENLQVERANFRQHIDESDMRYADLEDEFHEYKKEVEEEKRSQKGSMLRNLQMHSQVWILKNKVRKFEKQRDEAVKSCEILSEELQMAHDKLEAANLQMAEQEKTSRRVSTILKPGGELTGKDAIIRDLKDNLKRQKTYNDKLEKKLDQKQEGLRELEEQLKDLTIERDSVKEELQRTFSKMDVDDNPSGGVNVEILISDPEERLVTPDFSVHEENVNRQYNEVLEENEELKYEVDEIRSKLKKFSAELERERLYVENVESRFEQELVKNKELQDKIEKFQSSKFDSALPVIQESFEESFYEGNLTEEQIQELLDNLDALQEELNKEKMWVKHLEEQNDQLRIDLSRIHSVDKFTGDEKDQLYKKYSETEEMLTKRLRDLEEAQKTIDELRQKLNELKENEMKYRDDVENVSEQLEHSLIELSDHELMINALTVEKTDLEVQVRELRDEMSVLVDRTVSQQEDIIELKEENTELWAKLGKIEEEREKSESMQNSLDVTNDRISNLEQAVECTKSENQTLKSEIADSRDQIKSLSAEKGDLICEQEQLMTKIKSFESETEKLTEKLKEVTVLEESSRELVSQLNGKVEQLIAEKESVNQAMKAKEAELSIALKKMEESDIDTKEFKEKLEQLTELGTLVEDKEETIAQLQNKVAELEKSLENEMIMNQKNRKAMDEMQAEVRAFKEEKQQMETLKVETQARVKLAEKLCEEKVKCEQMMNEQNRATMTEMQTEVRREKAERAVLQTALADANKTVELLQKKDEENKSELEKLSSEIRELMSNTEIFKLQSVMVSVQEAMQGMEKRDADRIQLVDETIQQNSCVQSDLKKLKEKLESSTRAYNVTLSEKEATIAALETALSEEVVKVEKLQQAHDTQDSQVNQLESQSSKTIAIARTLEEKVKILEQRISFVINDADTSRQQLDLMEAELSYAREKVAQFEEESELSKKELESVKSENTELKRGAKEASKSVENLTKENKRLTTANKALQTELDIQLEARTHIDTVIEDKEKEFLEIADKYNFEMSERNAANKAIDALKDEKTELENSLIEAKKKLEIEQESYKNYQDEAKETLNSLNSELRQRLLDQAYAFTLEDDTHEEDSRDRLTSRPSKTSLDFRETLEETKTSVTALAKANDKLSCQIEKLLAEKNSFINKSNEESSDLKELKKRMSIAVALNEKLEAATKSLQVELIEKDVTIETLEENLIAARREGENAIVAALKRTSSQEDKSTLTNLHDLKHRCFMVIPSDPAREILHMFVSQYQDNLCSNCYARITTLGSRPSSPRKPSPATTPRTTPRQKRRSGGGTSDIIVQTDTTINPFSSDSAYSSTISMQTDQVRDQGLEKLKMKTNQLSNDLADSKKSEKELELALQYQLKIGGELQKKVGKMEIRERCLLDQISELQEVEAEAGKKEELYSKLVGKYRALKEELLCSTDLTEKLGHELALMRKRHGTLPIGTSTPEDITPPTPNECSLYLSPVVMGTGGSKLVCDRQIDTMSPLLLTWADVETQTERPAPEDSAGQDLLDEIKNCTQKLCHTLKVEGDTLPVLTSSVLHKIEQLRTEKELLQRETAIEMNKLQDELLAAKDQLTKTEEAALDIEEELARVLEYQEQERIEMQNKVKSFATQFKTELEKARTEKKFAEDALNKSIEKISEESTILSEQHEKSMLQAREEKEALEARIAELQQHYKQEHDTLIGERDGVEREFREYKQRTVAEKEELIESQTKNLVLLQKLKDEYERKEAQINIVREEFQVVLENLNSEMRDLERGNKDKSREIETLKNKIHQYTNREADCTEKLAQNQALIDALKREVLENREALENLAGYEVKCKNVEQENAELKSSCDDLDATKQTLLEEARELKEAIENARDTLNSRVRLDRYKTPALAALASLWVQEREELSDTKDQLTATELELQDARSEKEACLEKAAKVAEEIRNRLNLSETEKSELIAQLEEMQVSKTEAENQAEQVKEELNASNSQVHILMSDKKELEDLLDKQVIEKDRLMDDLNTSFKEKNEKSEQLESCLGELAATQDQLYSVKEELVKNRAEAEKLKESLSRARKELDYLEGNIRQIKDERDHLAASQPTVDELQAKIEELEDLNSSLGRRMDLVTEERVRAEETAKGISEKLERDIAEILEAFEDYKQKTGSSPERVQELQHGMAALQETLHQIMNTNSELNRVNSKLENDLKRLTLENLNITDERNELRHQLDNSLVDLSSDASPRSEYLAEKQALENQIRSLQHRTTRLEKLERDNTILKNKVRKMKEMLREKEDELVNLSESAESKEELSHENNHLKKVVSSLKQKVSQYKDANSTLKDKVRTYEEDRFMSSTPNSSPGHSGHRPGMNVSDEVDPIKPAGESTRLANDSRVSAGPSLGSHSRVSMTASQVSSFETISLSERCKTLDIELSDLRERYKILQETHESEQSKAHEMSDALRNSVKLLKNYIDRSGDVKGERMIELQAQLEEQRSYLAGLAEQLGMDLPGPGYQENDPTTDRTSLASGSTVCLDEADNQLI